MPFPKRAKRDPDDNPCDMLTVYLPKSMSSMLDDASVKLGLPKSRLICYAIDFELSQPDPFNYPTDYPDEPVIQYQYASEALRLIQYLRRWGQGIGRDMLVLARRDIGIEEKADLLRAHREAIAAGNIVEERPNSNSKFKYWKPEYKFTKIASTNLKDLERAKYNVEKN